MAGLNDVQDFSNAFNIVHDKWRVHEDEDESSFRCSKCKKVFHTMDWLKRRELRCKNDANRVIGFCKYVAKNLGTITFARDHLLSSSSMLLSIYTNFGNLKNFHQNRLVSADRKGLNPADELLLQKLVNVSFADISRHRSESVASANI